MFDMKDYINEIIGLIAVILNLVTIYKLFKKEPVILFRAQNHAQNHILILNNKQLQYEIGCIDAVRNFSGIIKIDITGPMSSPYRPEVIYDSWQTTSSNEVYFKFDQNLYNIIDGDYEVYFVIRPDNGRAIHTSIRIRKY